MLLVYWKTYPVGLHLVSVVFGTAIPTSLFIFGKRCACKLLSESSNQISELLNQMGGMEGRQGLITITYEVLGLSPSKFHLTVLN